MDDISPIIVDPTRRIFPVEKGRTVNERPSSKQKQQQQEAEPEDESPGRTRDPLGRLHIDEYV
ncbi:hypothetical protein [Aestuariirhabdus sp. LZHN29]|uniref:hypothetical protein n=1 Tax=Aestuariirhabdus sp. LZHN29 TaxID=3417462 RepID=UPI003CF99E23